MHMENALKKLYWVAVINGILISSVAAVYKLVVMKHLAKNAEVALAPGVISEASSASLKTMFLSGNETAFAALLISVFTSVGWAVAIKLVVARAKRQQGAVCDS